MEVAGLACETYVLSSNVFAIFEAFERPIEDSCFHCAESRPNSAKCGSAGLTRDVSMSVTEDNSADAELEEEEFDGEEGLGSDSDDNFEPWVSAPSDSFMEQDPAASAAETAQSARDETAAAEAASMAAEDVLSYVQELKGIRVRLMRERVEARAVLFQELNEVRARLPAHLQDCLKSISFQIKKKEWEDQDASALTLESVIAKHGSRKSK